MVEVTKSNFAELLPEIERTISTSNFIAIDTEFTGLVVEPSNKFSLFDNAEERYQKLKTRACSFIPIQVGISVYTKCGSENRYLVHTYVFYVRPHQCGSIDKRFMFQASAMDFLSKYNFDFNKFIREGIPYVNEDELEVIRKEILDGTLVFNQGSMTDRMDSRKEDILIQDKFFNPVIIPSQGNMKNRKKDEIAIDKLAVPIDNSSHEYFQLFRIRNKYKSLWAYRENDKIIIESVSPEEKKDLVKNNLGDEQSVMDFYHGFTKVCRILKEYRKPIVGHHCLMDLLLLYQSFHRNLPGSFKDFKADLHKNFPVIYDTKHIWLNVKKHYSFTNLPKKSGLCELDEMFKTQLPSVQTLFSPVIQHSNCDKYHSESFFHDSGYDSFITGSVFLKICNVLAMKKIPSAALMKPQTFNQHLDAVVPFKNKVNISVLRIKYINLEGSDPKPEVPNFLYVTSNSSKRITGDELAAAFARYPGVEFQLAGNKHGAVMVTSNKHSYQEIFRDFEGDPHFKVTVYRMYKHSLVFQRAYWFTAALVSGCALAFCIMKYR